MTFKRSSARRLPRGRWCSDASAVASRGGPSPMAAPNGALRAAPGRRSASAARNSVRFTVIGAESAVITVAINGRNRPKTEISPFEGHGRARNARDSPPKAGRSPRRSRGGDQDALFSLTRPAGGLVTTRGKGRGLGDGRANLHRRPGTGRIPQYGNISVCQYGPCYGGRCTRGARPRACPTGGAGGAVVRLCRGPRSDCRASGDGRAPGPGACRAGDVHFGQGCCRPDRIRAEVALSPQENAPVYA